MLRERYKADSPRTTAGELLLDVLGRAVPEVADGTVTVPALAGEAGLHLKIAVHSRDPDVDAVGACVGLRGSRILQVLKAVGGTLDLVDWHPDPLQFLVNALRPCEAGQLEPGALTVLHDVIYWHDGPEPPADYLARADRHVRLAAELTGITLEVHGPITPRTRS